MTKRGTHGTVTMIEGFQLCLLWHLHPASLQSREQSRRVGVDSQDWCAAAQNGTSELRLRVQSRPGFSCFCGSEMQ